MTKQTNLGHPSNQQPIGQISDGISDGEISTIISTSEKIIGILDTKEKKQLSDIQNNYSLLLNIFEIEVKRISEEICYDYEPSNFQLRITNDGSLFEQTKSNLFILYPEFKLINDEIISLFDNSSLKEVISKIIFETYIKGLVYELMPIPEISKVEERIVDISDISYVCSKCKKEGANYLKILEIPKLFDVFRNKPLEFTKSIERICKSGIKYLDFSSGHGQFYDVFGLDADSFFEFIKVLGNNGLIELNLSGTGVNELFRGQESKLEELFKIVGESGIISFIIGSNYGLIYGPYPRPGKEQFFNSALANIRGSGLKHLGLSCGFIEDFLNFQNKNLVDFMLLIKDSGLTSLNLGENKLEELIGKNSGKELLEFIRLAGESGIKHLGIKKLNLNLFFQDNPNLILEFIRLAGESGIISLDLSYTYLDVLLKDKPEYLIKFFQIGETVLTGDNSLILEITGKVGELLNEEQKQLLMNSHNILNELLSELELEVDNIRNIINYDYEIFDYCQRLYQGDFFKKDTLTILQKRYPNFDRIFTAINEFTNNLPGGGTLLASITSYYIEDLIFESMDIAYLTNYHWGQGFSVKSMDKIDNINYLIKYCFEEQIRILDISEADLLKIFQQDIISFIDYIKLSGINRIKSLNLDKVDLFEIFGNDTKSFKEFIKVAGLGGMSHINLSGVRLNKIFKNDCNSLIEFIKTAGESGIKSLDINDNEMYNIFKDNSELLIEFIKTAGESGIRHLGLAGCGLDGFIKIDAELLRIFIKTAGVSGIRSLDLSNNALYNIFQNNGNAFVDFIKKAGESGITNFNISGYLLYKLFEKDNGGLEYLLKIAGENGIKVLNISDCDLFAIVGRDSGLFLDFLNTAGYSGVKIIYLRDKDLPDSFKGEGLFELNNKLKDSGLTVILLKD